MTAINQKLSAKTVWGKVVLFLKEHHQIALHVACGDITDVELRGEDLVINVYDGMLVGLLEDSRREIENALRWQGLDLNVKVNIKVEEKTKEEQDLQTLKKNFGEFLIIKGDI